MRRLNISSLRLLALAGWATTLALGTATGCGKPAPKQAPPAREVDVVAVSPSPVRDTGEYLGSLLSRQNVTVRPQVAGYVRKILVRPGQRVEAGAPLIELDRREDAAALESAQAQRGSAVAGLELAQQTLTRTQALYKEGLVSAQELEQARAQAQAAQASQQSATAQVSQRKVLLNYNAVLAPFGGTVGDVEVRIGDYVSTTRALTSIAESDVLEVNVAVPSERARTLKIDSPVEVLNPNGDVLISTQVYFIAPQTDPRTQLVDVKAAFNNTVGLRPNELIRTRLVYGSRDALQVPALAVSRQSGQAFLFVVERKDGTATVRRRPVRLGRLGEAQYVVEQGLEPGALVAVSALQSLRDGMPVQPKISSESGQRPVAKEEQRGEKNPTSVQ